MTVRTVFLLAALAALTACEPLKVIEEDQKKCQQACDIQKRDCVNTAPKHQNQGAFCDDEHERCTELCRRAVPETPPGTIETPPG